MGACRPSPAGHRGLAVGGGGRSPTEQAERTPSVWKAACAPPMRATSLPGGGGGGTWRLRGTWSPRPSPSGLSLAGIS